MKTVAARVFTSLWITTFMRSNSSSRIGTDQLITSLGIVLGPKHLIICIGDTPEVLHEKRSAMTLFAKLRVPVCTGPNHLSTSKSTLHLRISSDPWSVLEQNHVQEQKVAMRAEYSCWDANIKLQNYGKRLALCSHIQRRVPTITVIRTHP